MKPRFSPTGQYLAHCNRRDKIATGADGIERVIRAIPWALAVILAFGAGYAIAAVGSQAPLEATSVHVAGGAR